MNVSFYNFAELHTEQFKKEVQERFAKIIEKNAYVEGEYNTAFENEFAKMQGSKHCLLLANGTDALEIALLAYGVKPGDKVGIAAISFFATGECVYNVGATPVFIDVDPKTGLMDPVSLKRISDKHNLKAIIPVHIYGLPASIDEIEKITKPKGIKIIEDGAQSQGGFYVHNKKPLGSSDNITTLSFYPTKNLGAAGDAGGVLLNDDQLKTLIMSIRNHGRSPNGHAVIGRNSRCDHLQAAFLHLKLKDIEKQNEQRKVIAAQYLKALAGAPIEMVEEKYVPYSSWHLFPIRARNRDEKYALKEFLASKGVASSLFYEKALPEEMPLQNCEGEREHAVTFAHKTLCLPMNPFLKIEEIEYVAKVVKEFYSK